MQALQAVAGVLQGVLGHPPASFGEPPDRGGADRTIGLPKRKLLDLRKTADPADLPGGGRCHQARGAGGVGAKRRIPGGVGGAAAAQGVFMAPGDPDCALGAVVVAESQSPT